MRVLPRTEEAEHSPPPLGQAADARFDHRCDASNVIPDYIMIRGKPILIDDLIQLSDVGAAHITPGTVTMLKVVSSLEILHLVKLFFSLKKNI